MAASGLSSFPVENDLLISGKGLQVALGGFPLRAQALHCSCHRGSLDAEEREEALQVVVVSESGPRPPLLPPAVTRGPQAAWSLGDVLGCVLREEPPPEDVLNRDWWAPGCSGLPSSGHRRLIFRRPSPTAEDARAICPCRRGSPGVPSALAHPTVHWSVTWSGISYLDLSPGLCLLPLEVAWRDIPHEGTWRQLS